LFFPEEFADIVNKQVLGTGNSTGWGVPLMREKQIGTITMDSYALQTVWLAWALIEGVVAL
jgi:hypothetical protein